MNEEEQKGGCNILDAYLGEIERNLLVKVTQVNPACISIYSKWNQKRLDSRGI